MNKQERQKIRDMSKKISELDIGSAAIDGQLSHNEVSFFRCVGRDIIKLLDALEEAEEVIKYYEQRLTTEQKRQTIQN